MKPSLISVVIPAYNEEENIALCLASLMRQTAKVPMEVILVDNNSKDRTIKTAEKFKTMLNLRIIKERRQGRGAARWKGFEEAKGSIVFSTDADAILPPKWIEKYLQKFEKDPSIVAVTGIPSIHEFDHLRNTVFNMTIAQFITFNYLMYGHPGLAGFGFAIKRSAYDAAGGFNPITDCYEDLDLAQRVHKLGKIAVVKNPPVTFSARRFEQGFVKAWSEYAKNFVDMFIHKQERVVLSNPRQSKIKTRLKKTSRKKK